MIEILTSDILKDERGIRESTAIEKKDCTKMGICSNPVDSPFDLQYYVY